MPHHLAKILQIVTKKHKRIKLVCLSLNHLDMPEHAKMKCFFCQMPDLTKMFISVMLISEIVGEEVILLLVIFSKGHKYKLCRMISNKQNSREL